MRYVSQNPHVRWAPLRVTRTYGRNGTVKGFLSDQLLGLEKDVLKCNLLDSISAQQKELITCHLRNTLIEYVSSAMKYNLIQYIFAVHLAILKDEKSYQISGVPKNGLRCKHIFSAHLISDNSFHLSVWPSEQQINIILEHNSALLIHTQSGCFSSDLK